MEVAGQWRRQWAGTAEYGKVTEGGVTRRVARAMEVMHASAPGAKVRVMRAAYHESASPGVPAASYLMHASRRVISSGFNILPLEPPIFPSKPLEISSMPLESSPEPNTDTENYKVTEPDDTEISEPSKWRPSTGRGSDRMPSEESSSTDNTSIIDFEARLPKNLLRKHSYDSENSDISLFRRNSRTSPLLDVPVSLSTLKYKSLLNGSNSNEWNNRRKSYSFEDTSPISESIILSNDTQAMESSTDSGICKSTELVNDADDKCLDKKERISEKHEESFQDWLTKNRISSYGGSRVKPSREHDIVIEEPQENSIALQSKGKVTITVPIQVADDYEYKQSSATDDRKIKKVGFCKTELHFDADLGKVNIIATDEKPPPSSDFRKRRSAFVPINGTFDKPITLFGESNAPAFATNQFLNFNEHNEFDENTAATKSILKNKIPKPKPYLLGENMVLGGKKEDSYYDNGVPTAVSLINRQLQNERRHSTEISSLLTELNTSVTRKPYRTNNLSPLKTDSLKQKKKLFELEDHTTINKHPKDIETTGSVKNKLKIIQMSPVEKRKTRQLRDSDLTYFGIANTPKPSMEETKPQEKSRKSSGSIDDLFQSVRLIQKVSNSVCNSEAESEDAPEYQNIPIKTNFAPVPTPRPRSKYSSKATNVKEDRLRPVFEQDNEITSNFESRRSRVRRQDSNRSISEPPKHKYDSGEKARRRHERSGKTDSTEKQCVTEKKAVLSVNRQPNIDIIEQEPAYVNFIEAKRENSLRRTDSTRRKAEKLHVKAENLRTLEDKKTDSVRTRTRNQDKHDKERVNAVETVHREDREILQRPIRKIRTEKLATPECTNDKHGSPIIYDRPSSRKTPLINKPGGEEKHSISRNSKHEHRSRSSQRHLPKIKPDEQLTEVLRTSDKKEVKNKEINENDTINYHTKEKNGKRESANTHKHEMNTSASYRNSMTTKNKEKDNVERLSNSKSCDHRPSKRSEYVINYDDKNGTVSSICKVKNGSGTPKKKKILKDSMTDNTNVKDQKVKNKVIEKIALLARPSMEPVRDELHR
ncbi:uncharacterized protein LOC126367604 isoform X3 [Pectinophora gossypiella]|uniref:uncharacterized protein LOC126367604 isoform X3 n=1 Tax=Pectinophora gossypiella TaxID=13191 RepID=UPI00214F4B49|nr:uncharacterized protein LOC126367604 isoform X3 [Pectinophora gossypiella]XP_049867159.1 uncharacterized protein LOC126367604 isoform X3 [Pectinophora gossypiella]